MPIAPKDFPEILKRLKENDPSLTSLNLKGTYVERIRYNSSVCGSTEGDFKAKYYQEGNYYKKIGDNESYHMRFHSQSDIQVYRICVDHESISNLCIALKENHTVTEIDLSYNCIDQAGLSAFYDALRINNRLRKLNLYHLQETGNRFSSSILFEMKKVLEDNYTLLSIFTDKPTNTFSDLLKRNGSLAQLHKDCCNSIEKLNIPQLEWLLQQASSGYLLPLLTMKDIEGNTLIHFALSKQVKEAVKYLLEIMKKNRIRLDIRNYQNKTAADLTYENADFCIKQHDYLTAHQFYDLGLAIEPTHKLTLSGKADALMLQKKFDQAYSLYEKLLEMDPTNQHAKKQQIEISIQADKNIKFESNSKKKFQKTNVNYAFQIPYGDLEFKEEIGKGGFGKVSKGIYNFAVVAIKELFGELSADSLQAFLHEMEILTRLRHPHVVQFLGACLDQGNYALVMEYMPNGSLYHVLHGQTQLVWPTRIQIALDIGSGLVYLHNQQILHRDLKSLNVLMTQDYRAKLTDFGLSIVKNEIMSTSKSNVVLGSLLWTAPEFFQRGNQAKHCFETDVYSYGVVMWEIASRKTPFADAPTPHIATSWIAQGERETIPNETPVRMVNIISACWAQYPEDRPYVEDVLKELSKLQDEMQYSETRTSSKNRGHYRSNFYSEEITHSKPNNRYRDNSESTGSRQSFFKNEPNNSHKRGSYSSSKYQQQQY